MARIDGQGNNFDEEFDSIEYNSQFVEYPKLADRPKSRSQKKREMKELQALGIKLSKLKKEELNRLDLPPRLFEALVECQRLKKEALRRQHQFIGTLMREMDPTRLLQHVENIETGKQHDAAQFQEVERWRDELLSGNNKLLGEIIDTCPDADIQHMRQLIRNANKERGKNKPAKSAKALFRYLRELIHAREALLENGQNQESE